MKKIVLCFIIGVLFLCGCGKKTASDGEVALKENQSMVIGKITEITGNDMTVSLVEEKSMDGRNGKGEGRGNEPMPTGEDGRGGMPEGKGDRPMPTGEGGRPEMPEGEGREDRPMPTGEDGRGEMPEGRGDRPMPTGEGGRPEMPTGEDGRQDVSESQNSDENKGRNKTMYVETGETASYSIPVGTTVTTALGAETTFSRLAQGDTVKIILENDSGNDTVVGIWIVE